MTEAEDGVPLLVRFAGRRIVVVGAGPVGADKLRPFLDDGADVRVIAPQAVEAIRDAAEVGVLRWAQRAFAPDDLAGAVLAIAATDDPAVNEHVAAEAAQRGTLCLRVDGGGDADLLAAVARGPLRIAVSTGGAAPALAARLREELAERYGAEYGALAALLGELRRDPAVQARLAELSAEGRRLRWRAVLDTDILTLLRNGEHAAARELAVSCLSSSSSV